MVAGLKDRLTHSLRLLGSRTGWLTHYGYRTQGPVGSLTMVTGLKDRLAHSLRLPDSRTDWLTHYGYWIAIYLSFFGYGRWVERAEWIPAIGRHRRPPYVFGFTARQIPNFNSATHYNNVNTDENNEQVYTTISYNRRDAQRKVHWPLSLERPVAEP
ncbi:hypothetical protein J6590_073317 [Homalodisca vitripennis]|nr:hypothetical protein J6590_073317 [Homalodisca vitripennis]